MKVAVLGYGSQGVSSAEYWLGRGDEVTVCDKNESLALPGDVSGKLGENYLLELDDFDLIVRSPSVHPQAIVKSNPDSDDILNKATTNTNEFLRVCPSKNTIGVTGTKGKGTTSTLITKMLEAAGKKVLLGGNIGTPPLEMLKAGIQPDHWVVLELANFQLIDAKYSPAIAVCLMIEPEHQDWHTNVDEYVEAKQQLFRWQTKKDIAVFYAANLLSRQIASVSKGNKIPYFDKPGAMVENDKIIIDGSIICAVSDIKLLGKHNWQNVCAAVTAVWHITQDTRAIKSAILNLKGLANRLELHKEINGIKFFNDSFAAAPGAAIAANEAIYGDKVLILGGHDRGLDLNDLAKSVKAHETEIHKVVLIGASAARLGETLSRHNFTNYTHSESKDMRSIVKNAVTYARPGTSVILSPGFASFDMFKNFEERGAEFIQAVDSL